MSDHTIFDYARVDPVYYKLGTFEHDSGRPRFVKAPFSVLHIPGNTTARIETYMTTDGVGLDATDVNALYGDDTRDLEVWLAREGLGFNTLETVVMEPNEMGNWSAKGESWKGMHCFAIL